ncbi:histidine kinase [Streptomyces sp. JJ38]|uniref:sensor histidine kinase n=1 Tax=Streptomyces sp. JJ38 TaxID=2738128 RepID=UPI001C570297|nr:histidine kinase [Streptomyces sp. JJ38]MBW1599763.1 two-component sensor histidine kinase [Streptomyces sp. JJ38]
MRFSPTVRARAVDVGLAGTAVVATVLYYDRLTEWSCLLSLAAAGALLLRRRFPRTVFLMTLPGLLTGVALIAAMVALENIVHVERRTWLVRLATACVVLGSFVPWPLHHLVEATLSDNVQALIYALMLGILPAVIGLLRQTRHDLSARITELATVRDHERALHAETVVARERARIAREMHDVVSHQASLIAVQATALELTAEHEATREVAGTLRKSAVTILQELRSMVLVLRASGAGPTELAPQPRLADLPRLVEASGVPATLHLDTPADAVLPEGVERAAYRTVQEALTNVRKHAPGASTTVDVEVDEERVLVRVRNGPATLPPEGLPSGGQGIVGLQERVTLLGGTFAAERTPDGFTVRAVLPLTDPAPPETPAAAHERHPVAVTAEPTSSGAPRRHR